MLKYNILSIVNGPGRISHSQYSGVHERQTSGVDDRGEAMFERTNCESWSSRLQPTRARQRPASDYLQEVQHSPGNSRTRCKHDKNTLIMCARKSYCVINIEFIFYVFFISWKGPADYTLPPAESGPTYSVGVRRSAKEMTRVHEIQRYHNYLM